MSWQKSSASLQPLECHEMLLYHTEIKVKKDFLLRKGEISGFQKKNLSAECLQINLCEFCDLSVTPPQSFSSLCLKYNDIKGREKGCVSFYLIIFVFGCCLGAWQPENNIVTSVTPTAGSSPASHSDTHLVTPAHVLCPSGHSPCQGCSNGGVWGQLSALGFLCC